ncbi:MAG: 16S rRNA processing protein RimM [Deltaproteobacteria bacterium]|nr:16S rRNA processing protein RimM [Deltaproteobacteria bacterium]MBW2082720.1 16S rRNA processing protein RimM [Deltaproteobacteria bacterium]
MRRFSSADLVIIGKVRRPHGLKGLLVVESYAESWKSFVKAGSVFLTDTSGSLKEYRVSSAKPYKRAVLLKLDGIESINEAEAFKDSNIMANKRCFKKASDEEFFWFELLGLKVYCEDGSYVGRLSQIIPTPANDVYVVREKKQEYLIPATWEVVREVDLERGTMIISPLDGMLEIDEN